MYTSDEITTMAETQSFSDQEITEALVHQAPGTPSAYERMLYTLAMHRPLVLRELGYCKEDAIRTAEVLHDLRAHPRQRSAS